MNQRDALIAAITREDRLLRRLLARVPRELRDVPGPLGELGLKDVLGHIAYWDDYVVRFFLRKLDGAAGGPGAPIRFEKMSRAALRRERRRTFAETAARYVAATTGLVAFLQGHWEELTERQKRDFRVPLRHRQHHRRSLEAAFRLRGVPAAQDGGWHLAEGA